MKIGRLFLSWLSTVNVWLTGLSRLKSCRTGSMTAICLLTIGFSFGLLVPPLFLSLTSGVRTKNSINQSASVPAIMNMNSVPVTVAGGHSRPYSEITLYLEGTRRELRKQLSVAKENNDADMVREYQYQIKSIDNFISKESDRIVKKEVSEKIEEEFEKKTQVQASEALENLPKSDFFHTVPVHIEADKPFLIQAGIVDAGKIDPGKVDAKMLEQIRKNILKKLNIKEYPHIVKDVQYQRLGIEVKLDVDKDFFKVRDIKTGIKPIIAGFPESWVWEVRPIKAGKSTINLRVVIDLKVPGVEAKPERTVFQEEREIHRNLRYSIAQFISSNWTNISTFTVGSGSLALFVNNWQKKREEQKKPKRQAGFAPGDATSQKSSKK
jgi:hypothetical protein